MEFTFGFCSGKKGKGKKKLKSAFVAKCHSKSHFPHFCFVCLFSIYNICFENFPVTLLKTKWSKERKIPEKKIVAMHRQPHMKLQQCFLPLAKEHFHPSRKFRERLCNNPAYAPGPAGPSCLGPRGCSEGGMCA